MFYLLKKANCFFKTHSLAARKVCSLHLSKLTLNSLKPILLNDPFTILHCLFLFTVTLYSTPIKSDEIETNPDFKLTLLT